MDTPKLLIADSSDELRQILFDHLSHTYHIKTCGDGTEALELARSFRPDILLVDLMLPGLDGLTLLQRIQNDGLRPAVLVTACFQNSYILSALGRLEVEYMMLKPCNHQAIEERLADLAATLQPAPIPHVEISTAVSSMLMGLGIATRKDGFRFLQAAIPLYLQDPGQSITKELYVSVGELYNKSASQVERSIRSAIESAWQTGDKGLWQRYFSAPNGQIPRPTNSDFISRIAAELAFQGYKQA